MALIGLLPCRISLAQQTQSRMMMIVCVCVWGGIPVMLCVWICKQQIRTSAFMSYKLVKGGGVRQLDTDTRGGRMSVRMWGRRDVSGPGRTAGEVQQWQAEWLVTLKSQTHGLSERKSQNPPLNDKKTRISTETKQFGLEQSAHSRPCLVWHTKQKKL